MHDHIPSDIPLPLGWPLCVRSAVIHVISLAHYAITCARGWAANSINARVRLAAENDRINQENRLLREEIRIKDARMAKIDPHRRPYYPPTVVIDHFSRRAVGVAVFRKQPRSVQIRAFLGRLHAKVTPKYIICDKGPQFWCNGFKTWCKRKGIKPRFGAVGKYGSIAVVERFIRTLKDECTRRIAIRLRRDDMRGELAFYLAWYNEHRPHEYLDGRTPNEVYHDRSAANQAARIEVRANWPPGAPCAAPIVPVDAEPGQKVELVVSYHAGRKHLPVIQLKRVA